MPILIDMKKKPGVDAWEGQVYNAKDGQLYSSTIKPVGTDQLEIQGCVLGLPVRRRNLDPRRAADSLEPRQQHGQGRAEGASRARRPKPRHRRLRPAPAPKTTGCGQSAPAAPKAAPAQKQAAGQPASPPISAISAYSPTSRGLPISAGWNSSTAASVMTSDSASSLPMLAVPG